MIEIDGSVMEGGGQILRISLSLSCLLKVPIRVTKIRAGRAKTGLSAQHLKGVELLRSMCNARVTGAVMGSNELEFHPDRITSGNFVADTQTAGSIALLIQVALPVALFSNGVTTLGLRGGTNAENAPQIDFITEIFRPNLEKFGASFDFELFKRGYFPKGGGHCEIVVQPIKRIDPWVNIEFGRITKYFGWCFVAGKLPVSMALAIQEGFEKLLTEQTYYNKENIDIQSYKERHNVAEGNAAGIVVGCESTNGCILGGSALAARGVNAANTGVKAANELIECLQWKSCVDSYVQDQIIIYMALADGTSRIRTMPLTLHTQTAIHVVEHMTKARFKVVTENDGSIIIECNGIGYNNQYL